MCWKRICQLEVRRAESEPSIAGLTQLAAKLSGGQVTSKFPPTSPWHGGCLIPLCAADSMLPRDLIFLQEVSGPGPVASGEAKSWDEFSEFYQ